MVKVPVTGPNESPRLTYTLDEFLIERQIDILYGMAVSRAMTSAAKKEADKAFHNVKGLLYRQWNSQ